MAQPNQSTANTIPRLVVKIVGSKQVKQLVEEPQEDLDTWWNEAAGDDGEGEKAPQTHDVTACGSDRVDSALWAVIKQTGVSEDRDKAELSSAVREELSDWQLAALRSAEDEVAALDLTFSGTLDRSEITRLFLKHDVPLKLPTFSLLLQVFSDKNDPAQVHYRNLLQFIIGSAFPEELQHRQ